VTVGITYPWERLAVMAESEVCELLAVIVTAEDAVLLAVVPVAVEVPALVEVESLLLLVLVEVAVVCRVLVAVLLLCCARADAVNNNSECKSSFGPLIVSGTKTVGKNEKRESEIRSVWNELEVGTVRNARRMERQTK
jgi:hypothetical protein